MKKFFAVIFLCFLVFLLAGAGRAEPSSSAEDSISLDLKNVEVVELLRLLSLKTGKTIAPSSQVTGRITLFLNNVAFEDVLDIVTINRNFALEKKGNIIYIMTGAEYKALYGKDYFEARELKTIKLSYAKPANVFNALSQLKSDVGKIIADEASGTLILIDIPEKLPLLEQTAQELDQPLETAVFDLNYAKAAEAKAHLDSAVTSGTGEVIIDERSSKAIVSDLPRKMEKLKSIVRELDAETRQVFIEADIVEVTLSDKFERGIDWEKIYSDRALDGLDLAGYFPKALSTYQKVSIGTLSRDKYTNTLNFLETYGDVKIISQPRIAVIHNEEAHIMVGTRDAYITGTYSQAGETTVTSENIEYVEVGVKLNVTPTINEEGFVTMKIKPEVSSVAETLTTNLGSRVPIVQTAEAETTVKVKDGAMIMIAGLMKEEHSDSVTGLPFLSRIPFIGAFFSNREHEVTKTELIIFITPHLMRGDVVLPGTEPEKIIREDIMPEELKEKFLKEEKMSQAITEQAMLKKGPAKEKPEIKDELKPVAARSEVKPEVKPEIKPEARQEIKPAPAPIEVKVIQTPQPAKELTPTAVVVKDEAAELEEVKKSAEAQDLYFNGIKLQKTGKWSEAIPYFQKSILLNPNFAPVYNQLGISLEIEGSQDKAEKMYAKAITVDPKYLAAYSNLALLNEEKSNKSKAIEYWRKRAQLGDMTDPWTQEALKRLRGLEGYANLQSNEPGKANF